jgi:hypothetical protein
MPKKKGFFERLGYPMGRAKSEGIYFVPPAIRKFQLKGSDFKVYIALCTCMNLETFTSEPTLGDLETWTGYRWYPTIRKALLRLEKRGLIKVISLRLSKERAYRKDTLTIRMNEDVFRGRAKGK